MGWLHYVRASIEAGAVAVRAAEVAADGHIEGDGGLEAAAAELAAVPPDKVGHQRAIDMLTETRRSVAQARQLFRNERSRKERHSAEVWQALRDATGNAQIEIVKICLEEGQKLGR